MILLFIYTFNMGFLSQFQNAGSTNKAQPEGPPILASLGLTPRSDKVKITSPLSYHLL